MSNASVDKEMLLELRRIRKALELRNQLDLLNAIDRDREWEYERYHISSTEKYRAKSCQMRRDIFDKICGPNGDKLPGVDTTETTEPDPMDVGTSFTWDR